MEIEFEASYDVSTFTLFRLPMYNPIDIVKSPSQPFTDYSRWRLLVNDGGRHTWHYLRTDEQVEEWPQNSVDKFWLGLDLVCLIHHIYDSS